MSRVDLGFAQESEPWRLESYHFPSKVGGKPAWLDLGHIPPPERFLCDVCHQPQTFFCQIYAPFEEDDANFHRTVFIFVCRNPVCCQTDSSNIKAFRCSLPRVNEYYSSEPPGDIRDDEFTMAKWATLCRVCGCPGEKKCSKCHRVVYCGRQHQIIDWKEGHKIECETSNDSRLSTVLFPEFELLMDEEDYTEPPHVDESLEIQKFEEMKRDGKLGSLSETSDIEKYAMCDTDKTFMRFKDRIADNPDQVLRYEREGTPLWIADGPKPDLIPPCEYCSSPRQFEFQIMPQMLAVLRENELDIGIVAVYTCRQSCTEGEKYKNEFVFKQDVQKR